VNKIITLFVLSAITLSAKAQQVLPTDEPFGKVSMADLQMTACDFEKDANAEVLIDKADLYYDQTFDIVTDWHERTKIFNDNGKDHADIRIPLDGTNFITGLQAETINLTDGKVEVTKLDKKLVYIRAINNSENEMVFTMPNVKPGCVIDYKYTMTSHYNEYIPSWAFQQQIPVRYSELDTSIPEFFSFATLSNLRAPYSKYASSQESASLGTGADAFGYTIQKDERMMANVASLSDEPEMSSTVDNLQHIIFHLANFKPPYGMVESYSDTWAKVTDELVAEDDFGKQAKRNLTGEEDLINKAKGMPTNDEKIAYLFNSVKSQMKWNEDNSWHTNDGVSKAWDAKSGNATEINLILYHLLKKSGVDAAMPMLVSTREHGKVNPAFTFLQQFNRTVVYIPVDSTKSYVLDASGRYNMYYETPYNLLNSSGFYLNLDTKENGTIFLQRTTPSFQLVYINAEIKPEGKMGGSVQISSYSYNRVNNLKRYQTDGEAKYIDYLRDDDNNLKISALKLDNIEVDTLPLMQSFDFNLDLAGSDDSYIYFTPNMFSRTHKNPFLSEDRFTDIDFGYLHNLTVNGVYKIPAGYTIDALPKSVSMSMPDRSIIFKRIVGQQDGTIVVRYSIAYKKSLFFKEDYADFHEFYKKMYEMLNDQIVLKKS